MEADLVTDLNEHDVWLARQNQALRVSVAETARLVSEGNAIAARLASYAAPRVPARPQAATTPAPNKPGALGGPLESR